MAFDWKEIGAGLATLLVGGGAVAMRARRMNSRERVDAAKDEAETRIISRLESERDYARDEARREREQRIADVARIARLESENKFLQSFVRRTLRAMPAKDREIFETDFTQFDDRPSPSPPPSAPAPATPPADKGPT